MSLDDYDVIRELGRGGMAAVHLARQRDMQRLVALKELGGFQARDPASVERFLRESRMAGSLNHPNIVTVYEYFEDAGTPYIAMELVEGGSLRPLIGELSLPRVARVLEDVLAAVGHAGKAGIVHRDIKPENTLITKDGRVKVADFGIAKGAAASGQQGLTSEGMTVGTPEYMSPEQALGKDVSPQSDLYSVGCMTYEMLTGRLPFTGDTQGALLVKQVSEPVPDVREVDPLIPESVAVWVAQITAKDPDDRFPDAAAAWNAFEEAVLEHIGPLWRRDATLEPGSEIDLSSIPEQSATPRKPSSEPIATTGYQTYQAPAALHEVLEGDPDAAPAVVTPPPRPVAAPAARRATPKPVAVPPPVSGGPAAAPKSAADEPEEPERRPLPIGLILGAAFVVAAVAFVVGMSSGGSAEPARAAGDGFVLKAPDTFKPVAPPASIPGLGAADVTLAPAGAPPGEGISAARVPSARYGALASRGEASRVRLGAGEAIRIADGDSTLFVLPTSAGLVVVSCSASPQVSAVCPASAGSLELAGGGKAVAPGPTDEGARELSGALTRLSDGIENPAEDLASAKSAGSQATAASDLAREFRTASREVRRATVGALAGDERDDLASALGAVAAAWTRYASAADAGSSSGVSSARGAVASARARVKRAREALADAGYPLQGG